MPRGASWPASSSENRWTAALLGPYAVLDIPLVGRYAEPLATLTILPPPCSSIRGTAWRQHRKTPRTLTSKTRHHADGSSSRNDAVGPATPALLTRRSTPPSSANHRSTSSSRETSPTSARPPISRATDSTCSLVRAVTATSIPAAASSRATFAPIPRPPPVTSATPSRRASAYHPPV